MPPPVQPITRKGKEVEGKGSNQADGEVQHVGLERVQLRTRVSSSTYKPQKKERGERQFGQQREDNEPGPIGSGGFVPRRRCPGLLARHAIRGARKRLLTEMGEDPSSQTPLPVFVRYFRQVFDHSGASTPMKREYLTLAHCLDSLLEWNVLRCLDIAVQRLKAVEQISQGVSPGTANRMEIKPADVFSLASSEEKRTVAQEHRRELKTTLNLNSWSPRGKGWGKPMAEDSGAKGEKGGKGGKTKEGKGKLGGKWRPPKGAPAPTSEVVQVKE